LKTPLTAIKVSADILAEPGRQVPDELHKRLVGEIGHGVEELQTQISTILDLAKTQSATLKLNYQPTDVKGIIKQVRRMVAPQVRLKEQTLELALADSIPRAMVDRERFKQILVSLVSNANKFTPKGGHISVGLRQDDSRLLIEVRDTGPGIALEEQERIFDAYYQGKDEEKAIEGTGLGLAIARALVELHGGRIWVESKPGEGSTFSFTLPIGREGK